jgi:hypothetical protein
MGADSVSFGHGLAIQQQNSWIQKMMYKLQLARAIQNPAFRERLAKSKHTPWYQQGWLWGAVTTVAVVAIGIAGHRGGWWESIWKSVRSTKEPLKPDTPPTESAPRSSSSETATASSHTNSTAAEDASKPPDLTSLEQLKADLASTADIAKAAIEKIEAETTEPKARQELLKLALQHKDINVVSNAIGKLRLLISDQPMLQDLIEFSLNHSNADVIEKALAQVQWIQNDATRKTLLEDVLNKQTAPKLQKAVVAQFKHLTEPSNIEPLLQKTVAPGSNHEVATLAVSHFPKMKSDQEKLKNIIATALDHPNDNVKKAAIRQFDDVTDLTHLEPLLKKATDPAISPEVATLAVSHFPKMKSDQEKLKNLVATALDHPGDNVKKAAISQIRLVQDEDWQYITFVEALKNSNASIVDHAWSELTAPPISSQKIATIIVDNLATFVTGSENIKNVLRSLLKAKDSNNNPILSKEALTSILDSLETLVSESEHRKKFLIQALSVTDAYDEQLLSAENITQIVEHHLGKLTSDDRMKVLKPLLSKKDVYEEPLLSSENITKIVEQLETWDFSPEARTKILTQALSAKKANNEPLISIETATQISENSENEEKVRAAAQALIVQQTSYYKRFKGLFGVK